MQLEDQINARRLHQFAGQITSLQTACSFFSFYRNAKSYSSYTNALHTGQFYSIQRAIIFFFKPGWGWWYLFAWIFFSMGHSFKNGFVFRWISVIKGWIKYQGSQEILTKFTKQSIFIYFKFNGRCLHQFAVQITSLQTSWFFFFYKNAKSYSI